MGVGKMTHLVLVIEQIEPKKPCFMPKFPRLDSQLFGCYSSFVYMLKVTSFKLI